MKKISFVLITLFFLLSSSLTVAQLKVGDNPTIINSDAILDIESTGKGVLLPRLALSNTTLAAPLSANVAGMVVYNTAAVGDVTPGYYYNDGTRWVRIASTGDLDGDAWGVTGEDVASVIGRTGSVGVGTTTPRAGVEISKSPVVGVTVPALTEAVNVANAGDYSLVLSNSDNSTIGLTSGFSNVGGGFDTYLQARVFAANGTAQRLLLNPLGGNVGIGNDNPTAKLTIASPGVDDLTSGIRFENGVSNSIIYQNAGRDLVFQKANRNNQLVLDLLGGVGLNTTDPRARLDVNGDARVRDISVGGSTDSIITTDGEGNLRRRTAAEIVVAGGGVTANDGDAWGVTGEDQASAIGRTGSVGVGTLTPIAKLTVTSPGVTDATAGLRLENGVSNSVLFQNAGNDLVVQKANQNNQLVLDTGGSIGINTDAPTARLDVNGTTRVRNLQNGVATDSIVTARLDGTLRKRSAADVVASGSTINDATDNHLGDVNQTLAANRNVSLNGNELTLTSAGADETDRSGLVIDQGYIDFTGVAGGNKATVYGLNGGLALGSTTYRLSEVSSGNTANAPEIFLSEEAGRVGDVGIRTTSPTAGLDVNGTARVRSLPVGGSTDSIVTTDGAGNLRRRTAAAVFAAAGGNLYTANGTLSGNRAVVQGAFDLNFDANTLVVSGDDDRVGIGTDTPVVALDVVGDIQATGNIVATGTVNGSNIPDYVFEKYFDGESTLDPSYKMMSLEEIEEFTKANKHLPGVQNVKQVKENGLVVNELTRTNLEKVEELFLHTIEQEKKIQKQEKVSKEQLKTIKELLIKNKNLEERIKLLEDFMLKQ